MKDLQNYLEDLSPERLKELASLGLASTNNNDALLDELFRIGRTTWYWETGKKLSNEIKDRRRAEIAATVSSSAALYQYCIEGYLKLVKGRFSIVYPESPVLEFTV